MLHVLSRADRACRASVARMAPSWSPVFQVLQIAIDAAQLLDGFHLFEIRAEGIGGDGRRRWSRAEHHRLPNASSAPTRAASPAWRASSAAHDHAQSVSGPLAATDIHGETVALDRVAACSIQDSLASTDRLLSRFHATPPSASLDPP